jgi:formate C-acetyltransferase
MTIATHDPPKIPGRRVRIERLKTQIMARKGSFVEDVNPFLRSVALWRASQGERSRIQVRAAYLRELVKLAPLVIGEDWSLAGNHLPTAHIGLNRPDCENPEHVQQLRALGILPEQVKGVLDAVEQWDTGRTCAIGETDPAYQLGLGRVNREDSRIVFWASGHIENHSIRDYAKVLKMGFAGIREEVEKLLAQAEMTDPDFPVKENFWCAALSICTAGILLGRRYAEWAAAMAEDADSPAEQERLQRMAELCARVPAEGARTLEEATQALWLAHILTCGEDGINANSLGRLDQILYPYYRADIEAVRTDRAAATDLMAELACRLYLDYDVQAITLGGVDSNGDDAVNELSHIILEATRQVDFVRDVSVRLSRQSPPDFVELAGELAARGGGIPFVFNDDCFIPALQERGIALADARDYAPIGCIELTIPGRANPHAVSGWFNAAKCLELAIFDGRDPRSGEQLGPRTGLLTDFDGFEAFFDAYAQQVEFFAGRMVYGCNRGELAQRERGPLPCWSVLTDDCIERGRDITDGGAVYNYHSVCLLGAPNAADAMMALQKLVFEDGAIPAVELLQALRDNFQGCESLRQMLLKRAPKYGNDCAEVDEITRRVCEHFIALMDRMESPLGGRYFVHLFSFVCHIVFGKTVGATPDGRFAEEPLAYSLSAHQGRDVNGITALLNSLARLPHDRAAGASAAIIELDPAVVRDEGGVQRLVQLTQTAVAKGIGQFQWNVISAERLIQAQEDPERYGNIAVRVAGFSQMFKLVDREMQDHIIGRTKHRQ